MLVPDKSISINAVPHRSEQTQELVFLHSFVAIARQIDTLSVVEDLPLGAVVKAVAGRTLAIREPTRAPGDQPKHYPCPGGAKG